MKIHTDKIEANQLPEIARAAFPGDSEVLVESAVERGSRSRARAFDIKLGSTRPSRKGTWIEWGDYILELFRRDEDAIVGIYSDAHDFIVKTQRAAEQRPESERTECEAAADRWSEELFWHRAKQEGQVKITRAEGS